VYSICYFYSLALSVNKQNHACMHSLSLHEIRAPLFCRESYINTKHIHMTWLSWLSWLFSTTKLTCITHGNSKPVCWCHYEQHKRRFEFNIVVVDIVVDNCERCRIVHFGEYTRNRENTYAKLVSIITESVHKLLVLWQNIGEHCLRCPQKNYWGHNVSRRPGFGA